MCCLIGFDTLYSLFEQSAPCAFLIACLHAGISEKQIRLFATADEGKVTVRQILEVVRGKSLKNYKRCNEDSLPVVQPLNKT